jgi:hypothetical protein
MAGCVGINGFGRIGRLLFQALCVKLLVTVVVAAVVLGLATPAAAGARMRHSGFIASIAEDGRTFVLAEVGPWRVRDGKTVITYRTITVTLETQYAFGARADRGPNGFTGDFVELPLESDGLSVNDYVTVDCRHDGSQQVALKIILIEEDAP